MRPDGGLLETPAAALQPGDRIYVRARRPAAGGRRASRVGASDDRRQRHHRRDAGPRRSRRARSSTRARSTFPARIEVEVAAAGAGHAARRDRAAAGERDRGEVALCPPRRPRVAPLCAGGASRGAALPRSAGWRPGASLHDALVVGDLGADRHLPLRGGARRAGGAGGGRAARCSGSACCSTRATRSSGWPRSTPSCSTRPAR